MTHTPESQTDLSARLFIELQQLTNAISLFRSFSAMVGFVSKAHYSASHVDQKECYTAEQWLSDFFANKTGLIPNFLDMNQCVPQSPEAAAKTLGAFIEGMEELPMLNHRDGGDGLTLFEALREDVRNSEKSRKLMQGKSIYITDMQKELALERIDDIEQSYQRALKSMRGLRAGYVSLTKQS